MTAVTRQGEWLGDYELLERIETAFDRDTYLAVDRETERNLEITVPSEHGASAQSAVESLVRVANLSLELEHPALASVLALDADARGVPFMVQEHVEGETVGARIDASLRGIPLDRVLEIMLPIAEAVARCHEAGLIHGRIDRDHVIVVDGLAAPPAKLIRPGGRYAAPSSRVAPELRAAAHPADARSDVWGIAALLHEMLLGTAPAAHLGGVRLPPQADSLPAELAALLGVCLAVAPTARPQNAGVLRDTLQRLRDERGGHRANTIAARPGAAGAHPFAPSAQTTVPEAAPPPSPDRPELAARAPASTLPAVNAEQNRDVPERRRRRRRAPLTDAELGIRAARSRRVRVAAPTSDQLPDKSFAGLSAKALDMELEPAPPASPQKARILRTRPRATTSRAIAGGGATPRQVLRSVRAAEKAAAAGSPGRGVDVELASQLAQLGELDPRPRRLAERARSTIDAIRRVGERDARRQLRSELFAMMLCALLFFGVPLLCDPSHARAEQAFGTRVELGVAGLAASAVIALMQLWWLQLSTRDAALWPATTALKALTLLVCFLAASHFVPTGTFGRLESVASALLPWTAGAFYLFLGVYGLSRTRYNTAQHAGLGTALAILYGGSVIGSYHVISASAFAPQQASPGDDRARHDRNSAVPDPVRAKRPSAEFGRDDRATEAELEAMGDTTGDGAQAGSASDVRDGSDHDALQSSEQVRAARAERAARLQGLEKSLKKRQQRR